MALGTGTRLGRYEIIEPLGAGGMGAVYRARDEQLGREVAIKVLLDEFTADPDRVRRFEREAKAAAALNHPNLLAVYDVGTHDGLTYLVSELLQGRTLRDVLAAGAMPPRRAARFAAQIADGLAAAHAKGIVHRDLKPANLFVTPDDRIKILDFGLARVIAPSATADDGSSQATQSSLTTVGTILGSAGYMAPEQVRGAAIDHRADIFSLGCVLYEMVAGRRAFHRETVAGTMAAIVESEPPTWSGDGSIASQRLMRIARRCLEKNPDQRFQSARDLAHVLADESSEESGALATPSVGRQPWKAAAIIAAALALGMTVFGVWAWQGRGPASDTAAQTIAFEVVLPSDVQVAGAPVLSNDGTQLAFVGVRANVRGIYLRKLGDSEARLLPGTEGGKQPFFSPRGDKLAFFAARSLKITDVAGGSPSPLCLAPDARGGAWGDDGRIVFAAEPAGGLSRIAATGGTPEPLTVLGSDEASHRWPLVLPDASGIVFVTTLKAGGTSIVSMAKGSRTHSRLIADATAPRYADGWLFYIDDKNRFLAAPFDGSRMALSAPGVPQPERFDIGANLSDFAYSVSRNGTFAYRAFSLVNRSLAVVGPKGEVQTIPGLPRAFEAPRLSPDGRTIAVTITSETGGDIWLGDVSGAFRPLTRDGHSRWPVWNPASDHVAVESLKGGSVSGVFIHSIDGRDAHPFAAEVSAHVYPVSWLANDVMLLGLYNIPGKTGIEELQVVRPPSTTADRLPLSVNQTAYGRTSPDGKWLAYTTSESGQWEVYLTAFPGPAGVLSVSKAGSGREPVWSKSGAELYFLRDDGRVMVVTIGAKGPAGDARDAGVGLFARSPLGPGNPWWDTMTNGKFIVTQPPANPRVIPISVVVNRVAQLTAK